MFLELEIWNVVDLKGLLGQSKNSRNSGRLVTASGNKTSAEDLAFLAELAEAGKYRAVIDRTYDFDEIAQAHRYVDTGRKRGNVVVRIAEGAPA